MICHFIDLIFANERRISFPVLDEDSQWKYTPRMQQFVSDSRDVSFIFYIMRAGPLTPLQVRWLSIIHIFEP